MPKRRIATLLVLLAAGVLAGAGTASAAPLTGRHLYGIGHVGSGSELLPFDVAADGSLVEREDQAISLPADTDGVVAVGRDARTVYVGIQDALDPNTGDPAPGAVDAFHVAADGSLTLVQAVAASPSAIAISPDGTRLFTTTSSNVIVSFPIASDGTLGAASAPTVVPGSDVLTLTLSPNGPTLYAGTYDDSIWSFAVGADGSLTQASSALALPCAATFGATAPGDTLDIFCDGSQDAYGYAIGADGSLASSPSPITAPQGLSFTSASKLASGPATGMAFDPSGALVAITTSILGGTVSLYPVQADGSLATTPSRALTLWADAVQHLVYGPDRSPVAALAATSSALTASFDAGASHAVDGQILHYDWDFGDGTTTRDAGPSPSHTYAAAGQYTATVTLTDSAGCSVASTYSGAGSLCAGSLLARASTAVHVAAAPVVTIPDSPIVPAAPVVPAAPAPATAVATSTGTGGSTPAAAAHRLALDRLTLRASGTALRLAWRASAGVAVTRYLVVWSTRRSAHARWVAHRSWTTDATLRLPRTTAHTIRVVLSAYGPGGALLRSITRTVRLSR